MRPAISTCVGDLVDQAALVNPTREALVFESQRLTFADFKEQVDLTARGLMGLGIAPGTHVVLFMPNSVQWLCAFYALAKLGAVVVPVNTRFRSHDLDYLLRQSDAHALIVDTEISGLDVPAMLLELLPEMATDSPHGTSSRYPNLQHLISLQPIPMAGAMDWAQMLQLASNTSQLALAQRQACVRPDDAVLILYTSGTTGSPKGAVHAHGMVRTMVDAASRLGVSQSECILLFLPLFHSMGLYLGGLMFLVAGARLVLSPRFEPALELERIERERVSFMLGFDTHYQDLLQHPDFDQRDRSSLRIGMVPAGSAASQATALQVNERLCRSFSGYGSSECGTAIALSFLDATLAQRGLGSGYPMPGYDFQVRHPETRQPLAANAVGELWIRGYGVMLRYHGKPQETRDAFDDQGWFKTGDMASMDEAGFLRYIGRYKDMLKVGGENVDPTEVEAFLSQLPGLENVKLVGVPDERLGDRPVACCTPGLNTVSLADVHAQCKGKIASFKIPRDLVWLPSYPMTSTGKLQRPELRRAVIQALEKSTRHLS